MCADNDRARGVETCAEMWRGITVRKVRPGNGQPQMGENLNCIRRQKRANAVFEKLKLVFEGDTLHRMSHESILRSFHQEKSSAG